MFTVLGCSVSEMLLSQWNEQLLCDAAPFFLPDDLVLPDDTLIMSRKAFSACEFALSNHDSYATYAVSPDAKRVVVLTSHQFDHLSGQTQQGLLAAQCSLKRGQVYLWAQVEHLLQSCIEQAATRCVTVSGEKYLVLDTKIWRLLTDELRQRWLIEFITADNPPVCLSSTLSAAQWSQMQYASIQFLAGTFAFRSGANCFSTTLAAITHQQVAAATIADSWLHQEAFFQGLAQRGYTLPADDPVLTPDLRDAVLIWQGDQGKAQHACYLIGNEFILNKNSQAWFAPRQLLKLDTLLEYWKDEPFSIHVYRQDVGSK